MKKIGNIKIAKQVLKLFCLNVADDGLLVISQVIAVQMQKNIAFNDKFFYALWFKNETEVKCDYGKYIR
ncbi:hypothetical protein [Enterococcus sp. DIV0170]|uniref:hypothetical protein n=1 Tax=Enterococcus sp. DIV0170 TaxID=2774642 RepID=UPI003F26E06A